MVRPKMLPLKVPMRLKHLAPLPPTHHTLQFDRALRARFREEVERRMRLVELARVDGQRGRQQDDEPLPASLRKGELLQYGHKARAALADAADQRLVVRLLRGQRTPLLAMQRTPATLRTRLR
ncbi:hypothetical protein [Mumia zhuanghuii]|uniref:Uncharacterized protein n=1 Tax=Mumia zhuanghuii TaxID=2585211 RepID=A0A5C4LUC4_9ACTN|nr:hypothetical protein [Mumia zhuanghuii]TNC21763.1 hypothetical protein FHE65_36270 [Mumia zhuanghuii]